MDYLKYGRGWLEVVNGGGEAENTDENGNCNGRLFEEGWFIKDQKIRFSRWGKGNEARVLCCRLLCLLFAAGKLPFAAATARDENRDSGIVEFGLVGAPVGGALCSVNNKQDVTRETKMGKLGLVGTCITHTKYVSNLR